MKLKQTGEKIWCRRRWKVRRRKERRGRSSTVRLTVVLSEESWSHSDPLIKHRASDLIQPTMSCSSLSKHTDLLGLPPGVLLLLSGSLVLQTRCSPSDRLCCAADEPADTVRWLVCFTVELQLTTRCSVFVLQPINSRQPPSTPQETTCWLLVLVWWQDLDRQRFLQDQVVLNLCKTSQNYIKTTQNQNLVARRREQVEMLIIWWLSSLNQSINSSLEFQHNPVRNERLDQNTETGPEFSCMKSVSLFV